MSVSIIMTRTSGLQGSLSSDLYFGFQALPSRSLLNKKRHSGVLIYGSRGHTTGGNTAIACMQTFPFIVGERAG